MCKMLDDLLKTANEKGVTSAGTFLHIPYDQNNICPSSNRAVACQAATRCLKGQCNGEERNVR